MPGKVGDYLRDGFHQGIFKKLCPGTRTGSHKIRHPVWGLETGVLGYEKVFYAMEGHLGETQSILETSKLPLITVNPFLSLRYRLFRAATPEFPSQDQSGTIETLERD